MGNYNRHLRVCAHAAAAKQTPFNRAHQMNISFALYLRAMFCRSSKERPAGTTKPGPLVNSVPYGNPLLIFGICLARPAPIFAQSCVISSEEIAHFALQLNSPIFVICRT